MGVVTRRGFIRTSVIGAGVLARPAGIVDLLAQTQSGCSITVNFNGTPIKGGDWVWFSSVMKVRGVGSDQITVGFVGDVRFAVGGVDVVVPLPPSTIILIPQLLLAETHYNEMGGWVTTVPTAGLSGNTFLSGAAFLVPPAGLPGGIKNVTWQGMFYSDAPGISVQWKWAAAVYHYDGFLDGGYELLDVKPVDDNKASVYKNSHHAGTPESRVAYVVGGARGGGGSNFTGSYSGTTTCDAAEMTGGGGSGGGS